MKPIKKDIGETITPREKLGILLGVMQKHKRLTRQRELALMRQIQKGKVHMCEKLFKHNLRLVVFVTKQMGAFSSTIPFEDLFMEGVKGLWKAVQKVADHHFDTSRNIRFGSFAIRYIQGIALSEMHRYHPNFHIPVNVHKKLWKMRRDEERFFVEFGEWYDDYDKELILLKEYARPLVRDIMRTRSKSFEPLGRTMRGKRCPDSEIEIEQNVEFFLSDDSLNPENQFVRSDLMRGIKNALSILTERQRYVLTLYFGLFHLFPGETEEEQYLKEERETFNLDEIGARLGIEKERVRQIKDRAIIRLRSYYRTIPLRSFLGYELSQYQL